MTRNFVGVDIQPQGLVVAALQRGRPATRLEGLRFESLSGVFDLSSRKPNIQDTRRFIEALRRSVETLAGSEERVSLSLPDRVGRIFLTEVDTPFKTHQEGVDVLKWQLKANLPAPPAQTVLDYQVTAKREDGRQHCVVAAIAQPVLEQYEDLVSEAGRHAVNIDFHSLNLFNYYQPRLDLGDEFLLVSLEQGSMSLQFFAARSLSYQRVREAPSNLQQVFREINRTLVDIYQAFPATRRCAVFAHVDTGLDEGIHDMLSAAFEREVVFLDPALKRFAGEGKTGGLQPTGSVIAALGAAERLM